MKDAPGRQGKAPRRSKRAQPASPITPQQLYEIQVAGERLLGFPLHQYLRAQRAQGRDWNQIADRLRNLSRGVLRARPAQLRVLADRVVVDANPSLVDTEERGAAEGFWERIRHEKHVHGVQGGLPGLGKRK